MASRCLISPYSAHTWVSASKELRNRQTAFGKSSLHRAKRVIRPGDVFLCYVIGEMEIVGALEATSSAYVDHADHTPGLLLYPVRVDTKVIARRDLGSGIHLHRIKERTNNQATWNSILRGSLKTVPADDAKWIIAELSR